MNVTLAAWQALFRGLGAAADTSVFQALVAAYSEPHRHYHTLQHLRECFAQFEPARCEARRPAEIELALWFHDAVYEPARKDNEQRSADWARDCALAAGLPQEVARRLHALVMATRHDALPDDHDARILVDVDLSILGAPAQRFDESEQQIRVEYGHVSDAQWREGRRAVLERFLARPRIYGTARFHDALEALARENLRRSLARL